MSKPIVVGLDPRREDREPLAFAAALARATGAPLIAVGAFIADPTPVFLVDDGYPARARKEAEERLDRLVAALPDVSAQARATPRSPARALHEVAEAEGAGLIVVGSTPRGVLGRIAAGQITDRTVHGAPCAVAVVPRGYEAPGDGPRRIGVAFTDTEEGRQALRAGAALARHSGTRLRVVTVISSIAWGDLEPVEFNERLRAERQAKAQASAEAALAELAVTDAVIDVLVDSTVDGLVHASQALDLLVCGSRGYGPVRSVLLGGVSRTLAREGRCPVIVIPRGTEQALEELLPAVEQVPA